MNETLFAAAFVTLFVTTDPLGTAAVFSALTHSMKAKVARKIAVNAVLIALGLYAFFGYFGSVLLGYMGISLTAFRIAGGLLLFVTAFRMIMGRHDEGEVTSDDSVYPDRKNLAVFPLAIPLLAGPGCLTALLLLLKRAESQGDSIITVIAALLCVQAIALVAFFLAGEMKRIFGQGLMTMIARVMGILLASMAVQFIVNGLREVVQTFN